MKKLKEYKKYLHDRELAESTIKSYTRTNRDFLKYAANNEITQDLLLKYKEVLLNKYKKTTTNTKLIMLNDFMKFLDKDISVKQERIQRVTTLDDVLSKTDYDRLVRMSKTRKKPRTEALIYILYYTGIRVSEVKFLTVEALNDGYIDVKNKGKHRRVPIANQLSKKLNRFIKEQGLTEGPIIKSSRGGPLCRSQIFRDLKWIGGQARVNKDKVYPHSFRHLFALQWLKHNKGNPLPLADILGHSSLETTRIYSRLSTEDQRNTINF